MTLDRRLAREFAPFGAATVFGFALFAIGNRTDWSQYAVAAAMTLAIGGMSVLAPWRSVPRALRVMPALLFLVALAILRDATGGGAAGVGALALVPVFWLALHGSRGELLVLIAGVCAFFVVPAVLVGGPEYPTGAWRMAVVFGAASAIVGIAVQDLVARVRRHADALAVRERDLEAVARLSRSLSGVADGRDRICAAAAELGGAQFAMLLEHQEDGAPACTATAGLRQPSAGFAPESILSEPVHRGDEVVGTLVVGWARPPADLRRSTGLIRLLAAEAAVVIERAELLGRLTQIAMTDALTGLPNRRAWDARLEQAMRGAEAVCVAILDLDRFKDYNDDHGHQAGDRLLKEAAAAWRAQLRPTDTVARYGGDEFVVLLQGDDLEAARAVVDRLRAVTPHGHTCSAGIARRENDEDAAGLVRRADQALYQAKRAGRNRSLAR